MPNGLIVRVPHSVLVLLRGTDGGVPVPQIDDRVGFMGYCRHAHPKDHCSRLVVVGLYFVIQLSVSSGVGREDDVVAVEVRCLPAVGRVREVSISPLKQHREIGLVRVRNLRVINRDGALVAVPTEKGAGGIDPYHGRADNAEEDDSRG